VTDEFFEEGTRLLTPHAFDFVLDGELKRAVRSQNFLTLVVLEARREWDGMTVAADAGTVGDVAKIVGHEVRNTDLLGAPADGTLSLVLLDTDFDDSTKVIDRVVRRIDDYDFPTPLRISLGAACYPTHAIDVSSLKRQALSRAVVSWRGGTAEAREADTRH
jgi:hypothetical protein